MSVVCLASSRVRTFREAFDDPLRGAFPLAQPLRSPHGSTRAMLEADQARLDREIDALRRGITAKTSELCTLDPSVADGSNIHEAFANLRDDG